MSLACARRPRPARETNCRLPDWIHRSNPSSPFRKARQENQGFAERAKIKGKGRTQLPPPIPFDNPPRLSGRSPRRCPWSSLHPSFLRRPGDQPRAAGVTCCQWLPNLTAGRRNKTQTPPGSPQEQAADGSASWLSCVAVGSSCCLSLSLSCCTRAGGDFEEFSLRDLSCSSLLYFLQTETGDRRRTTRYPFLPSSC